MSHKYVKIEKWYRQVVIDITGSWYLRMIMMR
jgi:hypothetical protein